MKRYISSLALLGMVAGFSGCGDSSSSDSNNNTYNLRAINKMTGISALLKGSYSNGIKGSMTMTKLDDGADIINGVPVTRVKANTSLTLDNGYTSQNTSISLIDENGFARAFYDTTTTCTLSTNPEIVPTAAAVGTTSNGTAIYSCDDNTHRTTSWSLSDAGGGNANYTAKVVISGSLQSESTSTVTITPQNQIIHYKIDTNIIAQGITASFEGDVQ